MKRSGPIRRKPRAAGDAVDPELWYRVLSRDGRCMAPAVDKGLATPCKDNWGNVLTFASYGDVQKLELDHVPDEGMNGMGIRATSDEQHLIAICPSHHRLTGWATSKRGRGFEREYLRSLYGRADEDR